MYKKILKLSGTFYVRYDTLKNRIVYIQEYETYKPSFALTERNCRRLDFIGNLAYRQSRQLFPFDRSPKRSVARIETIPGVLGRI